VYLLLNLQSFKMTFLGFFILKLEILRVKKIIFMIKINALRSYLIHFNLLEIMLMLKTICPIFWVFIIQNWKRSPLRCHHWFLIIMDLLYNFIFGLIQLYLNLLNLFLFISIKYVWSFWEYRSLMILIRFLFEFHFSWA